MPLIEIIYHLYDSVVCKPKNLSAFIQVIAAGANPVQITRGIEKTAKALVVELKKMSKEVKFVCQAIVLSNCS